MSIKTNLEAAAKAEKEALDAGDDETIILKAQERNYYLEQVKLAIKSTGAEVNAGQLQRWANKYKGD